MIKSLSVKQNVTFSGTNALARYTSSVGYADTCLAAARSGAGLGSHWEPIQYRAPASQPSKGKAERTAFAPNTETFSALHNISVVCLTRLARSPGGLGGRSRIEPRILISSLFAEANRGSLRGAVP